MTGVGCWVLGVGVHPLQLASQIIIEILAGRCLGGRDEKHQETGVVLLGPVAIELRSSDDVGSSLTRIAHEVFQPSLGTLPEHGLAGLAFLHHLGAELYHLLGLLLGYVAHEELSRHGVLIVLQVDGLLGVVHEVLQQEGQHGSIGILLVLLTDGRAGTFLIVLRHKT